MIPPPWAPRALLTGAPGPIHAVAIPDIDPPPEVLARLLPEERAFATALPSARLRTWVAGRLALTAALAELGAPRTPLLATSRDAPALPPGFVGSVSHKARIAVALAAAGAVDERAHVGIDVEEPVPPKVDIARRILTPAELAEIDALPAAARGRALMLRFSLKEAIYKALDPFVGRYVAFREAEVDLGPPAQARLSLTKGEGPFTVEVTWTEIEALIVTTARIRRAPDQP